MSGFSHLASSFTFHPRRRRSPFLLCGRVVFHHIDTPVVFAFSLGDQRLGCFRFLEIMKNASVSICIQGFVWTDVFISLGYV